MLERRIADRGIQSVPAGGYPEAFAELAGDFREAAPDAAIVLAGMVGSRQGWIEAPYLPCPSDAAAIARAVVTVPFEGADVRLVPGLSSRDADGTPEVMRGELFRYWCESPLPVIAMILAAFAQEAQGEGAVAQVLRGMVVGSFAFPVFFAVVALVLPRWGLIPTYALAAVAAVVANLLLVGASDAKAKALK